MPPKEQRDPFLILQERTGANAKLCRTALRECAGDVERAAASLLKAGVSLEGNHILLGNAHDPSLFFEGPRAWPPMVRSADLHKGLPLNDRWEAGSTYEIKLYEEDKRRGVHARLCDALRCDRSIAVSKRLREFLAAGGFLNGVEVLPIRLEAAPGIVADVDRPRLTDYALLNPLGLVTCIDPIASEVRWNTLDPEMISACQRLVLNEKAVPADRHLFRAQHLEPVVFIRKALAAALLEGGFTGWVFGYPATFKGIGVGERRFG